MIEFEDRGAVTILHMARGKGNALDLELADALNNALNQFESGVFRAGILTGRSNAGTDRALPAQKRPASSYANDNDRLVYHLSRDMNGLAVPRFAISMSGNWGTPGKP